MEFELSNIGLIKSATIKMDGLTVVGGHNSVGKSFIGKAIYAALKADKIDIFNIEREWLRTQFIEIIGYLNKASYINKSNAPKLMGEKFFHLYDVKDPAEYYPRIVTYIDDIVHHFTEAKLDDNLQSLLKTLKGISTLNVIPLEIEIRKRIEHNDLIKSVFKGDYNNSYSLENKSSLRLKDNDEELLLVSVENNETSKFITHKKSSFKDATLVESPIILSLVGYIRDNLAFSEKQSKLLPDYMLDLVKKLVEGSYDTPSNNELYNAIKETIAGQLVVDNNEVLYKDKTDKRHSINNTASGIKSFGILQLLLAGETINKDSILIIDEPEVHLHPEWQLEYAKLLVELVKNNVPVLVTTHSPYFLEALKVFSDKAAINNRTNFYLGEETKEGSIFKDVTQNLDELFEKFSTPMIKLTLQQKSSSFRLSNHLSTSWLWLVFGYLSEYI